MAKLYTGPWLTMAFQGSEAPGYDYSNLRDFHKLDEKPHIQKVIPDCSGFMLEWW